MPIRLDLPIPSGQRLAGGRYTGELGRVPPGSRTDLRGHLRRQHRHFQPARLTRSLRENKLAEYICDELRPTPLWAVASWDGQ
jgi:hypothetical protein